MTEPTWTLDELVERVAEALAAGPAYPGAPNGRVRDLPDRRAVRWYTTIGLVDRPAGMRGRTALYAERHLLQLVAVKRRQAQGRSLAEIQAELTGATDETLTTVAGLPEPAAPAPPSGGTDGAPPRVRPRFWAQRPARSQPTRPEPAAPAADRPADRPAGLPQPLLTGVPLAGGAVLLLPAHPGIDDLAAIRTAAGPLLDLLAERGLLPASPPITHPPAAEETR